MKPHQLQKASFKQRFLAELIDICMKTLYLLTFIFYFKSIYDEITNILFIGLIIITFISIILYPSGKSIGKFIVRIKIVDAYTSSKPTIDALLTRSFIKGYSLFNSILYGKNKPLHEEYSETKVVRLRNRKTVKNPSPSDDDEFTLNLK